MHGSPNFSVRWRTELTDCGRYRSGSSLRYILVGRCGRTLLLQMTPMEETFNDAIELAQRLERSDLSVYWGGYLTGLMRAFFGRQAVNNSQHGVMSDPSKVGEAALGYRDGYRKLAA